ncbi:hypothetical protein R3P38DRAFT_2871582 [Favolaschia claudopus]|uniref:Uncharacterized protein n=1 Tax=Favolaschia claudopus TaxID=2862362 RepID=A0AAW0DBV5_9AGAR
MLGQMPAGQHPIPAWPSSDSNSKTIYLNAQGRRHSTHTTPVDDDGQTFSTHSDNNSDGRARHAASSTSLPLIPTPHRYIGTAWA